MYELKLVLPGNVAMLSTAQVATPDNALTPERGIDGVWGQYAAKDHYTKSTKVGAAAWLILTFDRPYRVGRIQMKNTDVCVAAGEYIVLLFLKKSSN